MGILAYFFSQCRVNDAELKNYRKQHQWNLGLEDNKKLACSKLRFIARKEEIKFFFAGELCCVQKIPNTQIKDPVQ